MTGHRNPRNGGLSDEQKVIRVLEARLGVARLLDWVQDKWPGMVYMTTDTDGDTYLKYKCPYCPPGTPAKRSKTNTNARTQKQNTAWWGYTRHLLDCHFEEAFPPEQPSLPTDDAAPDEVAPSSLDSGAPPPEELTKNQAGAIFGKLDDIDRRLARKEALLENVEVLMGKVEKCLEVFRPMAREYLHSGHADEARGTSEQDGGPSEQDGEPGFVN